MTKKNNLNGMICFVHKITVDIRLNEVCELCIKKKVGIKCIKETPEKRLIVYVACYSS